MNKGKAYAVARKLKVIAQKVLRDPSWPDDFHAIGLIVVGAGIIAPILQGDDLVPSIVTVVIGVAMMAYKKVTKVLKKDGEDHQ